MCIRDSYCTAWSFARTGIGLGTLTTNRQLSAMTDAAVAANFHQTLDVQLNITAQIAFYFNLVDFLTNRIYLLFRQILNTDILADSALFQNRSRC